MSGREENAFAPLARRDGEPAFDEPWQAQALGLAFSLTERGVFSPADWSRALGAAHRAMLAEGAPDTPRTYYEAVVAALEHLAGETGVLSREQIGVRTGEWRRAYMATPHGQPVELAAGHAPVGKRDTTAG